MAFILQAGVNIDQSAVYRIRRNFKNPNSCILERWLNDPEDDIHEKQAYLPFPFGTKNLISDKNVPLNACEVSAKLASAIVTPLSMLTKCPMK